MSISTDTTAAEHIEMICRQAMAYVRPARGWDSGRERADDIAHIDALLDSWLELRS